MGIFFKRNLNQKGKSMRSKTAAFFSLIMLMFVVVAPSLSYADAKPNLDNRIWESRQVMAEIMATPDQSIPEELLAKCKAIAIYPNVLKGGVIIGARFGKGVVLKKDEKSGKWGPVAFSTIGGGSWGLQIGGSATDLILVIMNERGLSGLLSRLSTGTLTRFWPTPFCGAVLDELLRKLSERCF